MTRRANQFVQEVVVQGYDHAQATTTFADKLMTVQKKMRVDKVEYVNPTGLAAHADNYFDIFLKKDTTVMANWSTKDTEEGTLAADTFVEFSKSATDGDLVADAGDELIFGGTLAGTQTLPPGRVIIHGRYL